jgi:hypothetical protein
MALASLVALVLVFLVCFAGEPIAERFLGHARRRPTRRSGRPSIGSAPTGPCRSSTRSSSGLFVVDVLYAWLDPRVRAA